MTPRTSHLAAGRAASCHRWSYRFPGPNFSAPMPAVSSSFPVCPNASPRFPGTLPEIDDQKRTQDLVGHISE